MKYQILFIILCFQSLTAQNLLKNPESVAYDAKRDRYLVSNKADGRIIALDSKKRMTILNASQPSVRGLQVLGDKLYAAGDLGVAVIDLENGETIKIISIYGARFLNDITVDARGYLYVSDTAGNKIYKIRLRDGYISILAQQGLNKPNGLLYDSRMNRLLVCSLIENSPIQSVECENGVVTTIISTNLSELDGLARDAAGFIYVSSWATGSVYRFDLQYPTSPVMISSNHDGPADIFIRPIADVLVVPNFKTHILKFVSLNP